jgi:hypothetical protein
VRKAFERPLPSALREEFETKPEVMTKPQPSPAVGGAFDASEDFEQQLRASRGQGEPLPPRLREEFETKFGADFGAVRIHADAQADRMNRSIQAQAFTQGRDIYIRGGLSNLNEQGRPLLAHELTHVVQQTGAGTFHTVRHQNGPGRPECNITIQRKPLKFTKADLGSYNSKESHTVPKTGTARYYTSYTDLAVALDEYHKAQEGSPDELLALQRIEALGKEWLAKSRTGGNTDKLSRVKTKAEKIETLLSQIEEAFKSGGVMNIQNELYQKKLKTTESERLNAGADAKSNLFLYLTMTGFGAFSEIDRKKLQDASVLTDEQIRAIRIYTAADYKYINPVLANKKELLEGRIAGLTSSATEGFRFKAAGEITAKEKVNKWRPVDREETRRLRTEAMQHYRLAVSGLEKLPLWQGVTYRGMWLTESELADYQVGKTIEWRGFASTTKTPGVAVDWITNEKNQNEENKGKKKVLFTVNNSEGKDISKISVKSGEEEVLLHRASVKVDAAPQEVGNGDTKYFAVSVTQQASTPPLGGMVPTPTVPTPTVPTPTGPMPTGPTTTGPMPTGLTTTGPTPTVPTPTGPMPTGPMPTGPMPTGPMPTGPMPTGPMPTGPMPTGPTPTGPTPTGAPWSSGPFRRLLGPAWGSLMARLWLWE